MSGASTAAAVNRIAAGLITGILVIAAGILFVGFYLLFPAHAHAFALLLIGMVAVVFAAIAYLFESFSRRPTYQRTTAWGFYAFGFAVLLLTLGLNPTGYLSLAQQLVGVVVTLLFLAGSIAGIAWRYRSAASVPPREAGRAAWRASTPQSAFDYPTAHSPTAPVTPPATSGKTPPSGGGA